VWFVADRRQYTRDAAPTSSDLDARVSCIAQAIAAFDEQREPGLPSGAASLFAAPMVASARSASEQTVCAMVDVMKQYDAHGNPLAMPNTVAASASLALKPACLQDAKTDGFLASVGS
jgi:hypothetical protein